MVIGDDDKDNMILSYLQPTVILIVFLGISRLLDYWFITNKEVIFISGDAIRLIIVKEKKNQKLLYLELFI